MRTLARSEEEITNLLNRVAEQINQGGSMWPGETYEQGVENALLWLFGDIEDHPLDS